MDKPMSNDLVSRLIKQSYECRVKGDLESCWRLAEAVERIEALEKDAALWKKSYFDTCTILENFHAMVRGESPSILENDCNAIAAEIAIDSAIAAASTTGSRSERA